MGNDSETAEFSKAWAAFGEAFNLLGLGRDNQQVLAHSALTLAEIPEPTSDMRPPGVSYLAECRERLVSYIAQLRAEPGSRADFGIMLLSLEFILRASQYEHDRRHTLDECVNCGFPHFTALPVTPGNDLALQCIACGYVTKL